MAPLMWASITRTPRSPTSLVTAGGPGTSKSLLCVLTSRVATVCRASSGHLVTLAVAGKWPIPDNIVAIASGQSYSTGTPEEKRPSHQPKRLTRIPLLVD